MIAKEKLEGYLLDLSLTYEEQGEGIWLISDDEKGLESAAVMMADPIVVIQVKVMRVPDQGREQLFEQLLRLNASDLVHGAYAVEGGNVILLDTLEGDTMDLEELQASLEAMGLALSQHYEVLSKYRD